MAKRRQKKPVNKTDTPLSERQRLFVEAYLEGVSGTEAAKRAGYAHPDRAATRLLRTVQVAKAIKDGHLDLSRKASLTREDKLRLLAGIALATQAESTRDRIAALKLHCQMTGDLLQRHEVSGPNGSPIQVEDLSGKSHSELLAILHREQSK